MLSVRGVSKTFGAVQALRDVSFDCRAGEIHALVGENGSGKSTLLGIASGFLAPDAGAVEIGGSGLRRASPATARRLGLGIAYQDYSHVLDLTVAENLYLGAPGEARARRTRTCRAGRRRRSRRSSSTSTPATPTGALSLAERQLLEVVKALLLRPKVLLLDEPTTALGPDDGRPAPRPRARAVEGRRRHRLRQPPPARGALGREPRDRVAGRGRSGHLRLPPRCRRTP